MAVEDEAAESTSSSAPAADGAFWQLYYGSRSSTWIPLVSPLAMFQEKCGFDPWKLLACCILSSRTSGSDKVWDAIREFHRRFPTPSSVLDEADRDPELLAMGELLLPLGLKRQLTITRMARGFLSGWTRPSELHGCGKFAEDSWLTFCHGKVRGVARDAKADRNVRAYAQWAVRTLRKGGAPSAAAALSDEEDEEAEEESEGEESDFDEDTLSLVLADKEAKAERAKQQAESREARAARRRSSPAASASASESGPTPTRRKRGPSRAASSDSKRSRAGK